jgi:hypothetical protein
VPKVLKRGGHKLCEYGGGQVSGKQRRGALPFVLVRHNCRSDPSLAASLVARGRVPGSDSHGGFSVKPS